MQECECTISQCASSDKLIADSAWVLSRATPQHTPAGRGYDTGLSYFHHSNDYYTESGDGSACHFGGRPALDIWGTSGPASNFNTSEGRQDNMKNGSLELYEETKFMRSVMATIATHPKNEPLFMTYASHLVHEPLQVPTVYLDRLRPLMLNASGAVDNTNRLFYQAMVSCLDDVVGNVTYSLRQAELWDDTFFLLTSDNVCIPAPLHPARPLAHISLPCSTGRA